MQKIKLTVWCYAMTQTQSSTTRKSRPGLDIS